MNIIRDMNHVTMAAGSRGHKVTAACDSESSLLRDGDGITKRISHGYLAADNRTASAAPSGGDW